MAAFWVLLALIAGYGVGWAHAHSTVADECDRLGGFYVGDRTYRCTLAAQQIEGEK